MKEIPPEFSRWHWLARFKFDPQRVREVRNKIEGDGIRWCAACAGCSTPETFLE